ncbi:hypothetical protein DVH24_009198 [Malus domestica]|uniref:Nucleotide-diphospho-sugar transferase domain-containing protein n=1 Tax=Malus domestica TaxID=3750 RepID=A0A498JS98_MALDO|nr:hypothetical protein DVH24_009198 [Malus domestica]
MHGYRCTQGKQLEEKDPLDKVLKNACMKDKAIITFELNESFEIGSKTKWLLIHFVVICLDEKAYARCLALLPHCYQLKTQGANFTHEAVFTSSNYLQITWGKVQSISLILEKGYSFVITDNDIMWLRNPFSQFNPEIPIFKFLVILTVRKFHPTLDFPMQNPMIGLFYFISFGTFPETRIQENTNKMYKMGLNLIPLLLRLD